MSDDDLDDLRIAVSDLYAIFTRVEQLLPYVLDADKLEQLNELFIHLHDQVRAAMPRETSAHPH